MPTSTEHMRKYKINREVLDSVFDKSNATHYDWITTVCFYTSLHIIEAKFAKKSINNRTHTEREENMISSDDFSRKITDRYKQLSTYSKVARYGPGSIDRTIVSYSLELLKKIEDEVLPQITVESEN